MFSAIAFALAAVTGVVNAAAVGVPVKQYVGVSILHTNATCASEFYAVTVSYSNDNATFSNCNPFDCSNDPSTVCAVKDYRAAMAVVSKVLPRNVPLVKLITTAYTTSDCKGHGYKNPGIPDFYIRATRFGTCVAPTTSGSFINYVNGTNLETSFFASKDCSGPADSTLLDAVLHQCNPFGLDQTYPSYTTQVIKSVIPADKNMQDN